MKEVDNEDGVSEAIERERFFERRLGARHQTTIVVQDKETSGRFPVRGDINKDGYIFLPEFSWIAGKQLDLAIRLPGLGEWIECTGVVQARAVRGKDQGIVSRIVETDEKNERFLLIWKKMSECPSRTRMMASSEYLVLTEVDPEHVNGLN